MKVESLGYKTDLIFPGFDGEIIDRGDYLVILTRDNPTYHWGNFILFKNPPKYNDVVHWKKIFEREITSKINSQHMTFGWDSIHGTTGEVELFVNDGFEFSKSIVLETDKVKKPAKYNLDAIIRPLITDKDWQQATKNQISCREPKFSFEAYTKFKTEQMTRYKMMAQAGIGNWFGAFLGDKLVADLGIFFHKDTARFQNVCTHPDYRRQGLCGSMVYQSSQYAFEKMKVKSLVMVADEEYHAARIYESLGFVAKERQVGLSKS